MKSLQQQPFAYAPQHLRHLYWMRVHRINHEVPTLCAFTIFPRTVCSQVLLLFTQMRRDGLDYSPADRKGLFAFIKSKQSILAGFSRAPQLPQKLKYATDIVFEPPAEISCGSHEPRNKDDD